MGIEDDGSVPPMKFEQVPCSDPISTHCPSGTTGPPKDIVYGSN
ncbi:hypothetical protein NPIL_101771, partial [Nephila pilipes]